MACFHVAIQKSHDELSKKILPKSNETKSADQVPT